MSLIKTEFSPAEHGFRFINRFEAGFPVKINLPLIGEINLNQVVFGLCGGMCFSALDYYYGREARPEDDEVSRLPSKLFVYLCERQLDSLRISVVLKVLEWMLLEDVEIYRRMARTEIPKLRRSLDRGEPAVLALIRASEGESPTQNHQVVATGYDFDPDARTLTIELYDPNHPSKEPKLHLNLATGNARAQPGWITQSTGEELRGFFVIPYKLQKAFPRLQPQFGTLGMGAGEEGFRLRWPVDSARVTQQFGVNPQFYKGFGLAGHEGLDLLAPSGANVYASADGEVYLAKHPSNHPYGLHIRIKHEFEGQVYHTIYAHLSQIFVSPGQRVRAGERIGLADNTGNSFGSHLHLTLKLDGAKTPGYPDGIINPLPYLMGAGETEPEEAERLPTPSGLAVYTTSQAELRASPDVKAEALAIVAAGEALETLGEAEEVRVKTGKQNAWLQVKTASGKAGFVPAWLVQSEMVAFPPSKLIVYPSDVVRLRSGPGTQFQQVGQVSVSDPLTVLGDEGVAINKIGQQGQWIQVQTGEGKRGFIAAWLVHQTGEVPKLSGLTVEATDILNIRARPGLDSNVLTVVPQGEQMAVLGDPDQARPAIGGKDCWLNVKTQGKLSGYVAAWLVRQVEGNGKGTAPIVSKKTVFPTADINLRAQPSQNAPRISGAFRNEALQVLEDDLKAAAEKIGKTDSWIFIQKKNGQRGWAAAWFLSAAPA